VCPARVIQERTKGEHGVLLGLLFDASATELQQRQDSASLLAPCGRQTRRMQDDVGAPGCAA